MLRLLRSLPLLLLLGCQRAPARPAAPAARVVSLTPSLTEMVFALGAGDRLVGVSDYCDYPKEALLRPRVGTFLQPSLEKILALRPDLVLLDGVQGDVAGALQQAGVHVLPLPLQSLSDVRGALLTLGGATALGRPKEAAELVARFDRERQEVTARVAQRPRQRVLFVVDREVGGLRGIIAAGPGSYLDELLSQVGGDNIFHDLPVRYAKVAVEAVAARRPEVILDAVHVSDAVAARADWQAVPEVPAVQAGRVHLLQRVFVTPGPRLTESLRELAALLHPETLAAARP